MKWEVLMDYHPLDREHYYRREVFRHFTEDCRCSSSITAKVDVTALAEHSRRTGTKFYINFLYLLSSVLNSREDYRIQMLYPENELVVFDTISPAHYIFHEDTETCTVVYTDFCEDYEDFYRRCTEDIQRAKSTREYGIRPESRNFFDASYLSWLCYDALHIELPDGYPHYLPIINWGHYEETNGRLMLPLSVRINHAVADGYLISKVFLLLQEKIAQFTKMK